MSLRASGTALDSGPAPARERALAASPTPTAISVPPLASAPVVPFVPFVPQHAPTRATEAEDSVLALFDKMTLKQMTLTPTPTGAPQDKRSSPDSSEPDDRDNKVPRSEEGGSAGGPSDLDQQIESKMQTLRAIINKVQTHGYDKKNGYPTMTSVRDELKIIDGIASWKLDTVPRNHPKAGEFGLLINDAREELDLLNKNRAKAKAEAEAAKKAAERQQDDADMERMGLTYEELLAHRERIRTTEGKEDLKEMKKRGLRNLKELDARRAYEATEEGQAELARQAEAEAAAKAEAAAAKKAATAEAAAAKKAATARAKAFEKAKKAHDKEVADERQRLLGLLQGEDPPTGEEFNKLSRELSAFHTKEVAFLDDAGQEGNMTEEEVNAALQIVSRDHEIEKNLLDAAREKSQAKARAEREKAEAERRLARAGEDKAAMEKLYRMRHQFFVRCASAPRRSGRASWPPAHG